MKRKVSDGMKEEVNEVKGIIRKIKQDAKSIPIFFLN